MSPETKDMLEAELARVVRWERTEWNEVGYDANGDIVVRGCRGGPSGYDEITDAQDLMAYESQDVAGDDDWA